MIFDLNQICSHFNLKIKGVLHIGAFIGEELTAYRKLGLTNTILFEPQKHLCEMVQAKCGNGEQVFNLALGSHPHQSEMFISKTDGGIYQGSGASSSLLKPKKHLTEHPHISFDNTELVTVECLDTVMEQNNLNTSEYNFLNIDVQGYELEVLKGATKTLENVDAMILAINRDEMYEGCPMVEDIDSFLREHNIVRAVTYWQSESWGDGVYVRT